MGRGRGKKLIEWIEWSCKYGKDIKWIESVRKKNPDALSRIPDSPELCSVETDFSNAYVMITHSREKDCGIKMSEIKAYLDLYPHMAYDTEAFVRLLMAMDRKWMAHYS